MTDWPDLNPYPALIEAALREVLGLRQCDPADVTAAARQIYAVSQLGRAHKHANNRPASSSASENELRKFHDLCGRLADHIEAMHNPAISALAREGLIARDLLLTLHEAQETARHAFGELENAPPPRGRPQAFEAAEVTHICAHYYRHFTDKEPTRSADSEGEYGDWLDTLRAVFKALRINASPEKQAQAYRTKIGQERGI